MDTEADVTYRAKVKELHDLLAAKKVDKYLDQLYANTKIGELAERKAMQTPAGAVQQFVADGGTLTALRLDDRRLFQVPGRSILRPHE